MGGIVGLICALLSSSEDCRSLSNFDGLVLLGAAVLVVAGVLICSLAFLDDYFGRRRRSRLMHRPRLQDALDYIAIPDVLLVRPPLRNTGLLGMSGSRPDVIEVGRLAIGSRVPCRPATAITSA